MKKVNANEPEGTASKFSGDRERGTGSKWVKVWPVSTAYYSNHPFFLLEDLKVKPHITFSKILKSTLNTNNLRE